jgi:hypothetical protein
MSNLKKTIQINPELFKIQTSTKSRTKSNRDKSNKTITPSFLKKQLIDRIKSHKNKLETTLKEESLTEKEKSKEEKINDDDEFILSMNFLSTLSNEKKTSPTKTTFIDNIKSTQPQVHVELPNELLENHPISYNPIPVDSIEEMHIDTPIEEMHIESQNDFIQAKYTPPNDVPYGCLKNGKKPTYRSWMNKSNCETLKNHSNNINQPLLEREKKLNELKNKFSREKEKEKEKTFIKRTIKKKYTLGKSNIKKKVGILIKNMNTRKKIIDSHKELKTHDINDVKKYLRNRGFIRIGNTTPHDVLRKIYESSILSGDIRNNNKDILLHNLLNEE